MHPACFCMEFTVSYEHLNLPGGAVQHMCTGTLELMWINYSCLKKIIHHENEGEFSLPLSVSFWTVFLH